MKRKAPVTMALLVIIAIVFAFEVLTHAYDDGEKLLAMGALSHDLVFRGQIWRLITYMFLHGGWPHWLANSWALYQLGTLYEALFGSKRFAAIYFTTGVVAGVASAVLHAGPAVGASGAVFGIMGAFIFSIRRSPLYRHQPWTRSLIGQLVFWIVINIAIGYSLPFIDNTAHVGGLITGLLLGLTPHHVPPPPPRESVIDVAWNGSAGRTGESDLRPPEH
jgi:rhomboid protease GluP